MPASSKFEAVYGDVDIWLLVEYFSIRQAAPNENARDLKRQTRFQLPCQGNYIGSDAINTQ